ncbi:MAG: peptidoglycan-binding domain-containing protein [Nitrospirota bacterium]
MKKLISLLIGCSLALAGAALAQQPAEQQSPAKGKRAPEKTHATQPQPRANPAKPQERPNQTGAIKQRNPTNERSATNEHATTNAPDTEKSRKTHAGHEAANTETNASGQATGGPTNEPGKNRRARAHDESANAAKSNEKQQAEQQRKEQRKDVNEPATAAKTSGSPAAEGTHAAPQAAGAGQQNAQVRGTGKAKKPAPQQVQQVKSQHTNFRAQPKPQQVPSVTFNQNHRIEGSDHWQGQQYQVFRSYQPQWHDEGWYRSHYQRVELIGGGYYYFNNGYWFPAWGYSPSAQYYAYDGPIYVGHHAEPPDRVIADTQALLQQMGYYTGEVDGLLGPLTRQALAAYQADNGLTQTASIDEPTLDSLGLA